jgi:hypothetical protein
VDAGLAVHVIVNGCPAVAPVGLADKLMMIGVVPASGTVMVAPLVTTLRSTF